jgi:5-methylcytosine-specific restriction endonuclease McrA
MRKAWIKWPPRAQCLQAVKRPYTGTNTRQRFEYQCAHCLEYFSGKQVSVDHIVPWGKIDGLSLEEAWSRLLVPISGLQVLCESCHDVKTAEDKMASS